MTTTLLGGVLSLVLVSPATANHGTLKLEVYREVTETPVGDKVTLTARLMGANGTPPTSGGTNVEIDWEIEGGAVVATTQKDLPSPPAGGDGSAITPESPDHECSTPAVVAAGSYPECSVAFTAGSSTESLIRAWIDHDGKNDNAELGSTEADPLEGRLSSPATDCVTEFPGGPGDADDGTFADCAPDGEATAGRDAERDETDVVSASFYPGGPVQLNCADLTLAKPGEDALVRCVVSDDQRRGRPGHAVDAKHMTGANDPGTDSDELDYEDGDQTSSAAGVFTVVVDGSKGQTGFAEVCAWIDTDDGIPDDQPLESYNEAGAAEDGGECDTEALANSNPTNTTDRFQVRWQAPQATTIDLTPETLSTAVGTSHTITAQVLDQFGGPWTTPVQVGFEFLAGSTQDFDGSVPSTADRSCTTAASDGRCTFGSYTSSSTGTDTVCGWFGATPSETCNREAQDSDGTSPTVDVVTKTWTAPAPGSTTTTSTPPGGGGGGGTGQTAQGYSLVGEDGSLYAFGSAQNFGDMKGKTLNAPIIGVAYTPGGSGYWLVAKDGGIFTFGNAAFFGSMGDQKLNSPVIGMAATPTGKGYWLFAGDGGIFTFGDAVFFGSMGDKKLNQPVINMEPLASGNGYWLVAADGGIFSFGRANFFGSMGDQKINQPVFDMTSTDTDNGYWLIARDGGVFSFGDAAEKFYGNPVNDTNPRPTRIIGMDSTPNSLGYWIADASGKVWNYGNAQALGDRYQGNNPAPMIGFASVPGLKP
ncbi:MAG TPA: hypothetical protein VM933_01860 [Acidimicrobiales bacterium]|nr:hypothetical protein [Acidimicrobiales bacterium]